MDFNKKVNQLVVKEVSAIFEEILSKNEDKKLNEIDVDTVLSEHFLCKVTIKSQKSEKDKKKRVVKEVPVENMCFALKVNGDRCSRPKYIKGDNKDLCSIHNKTPPKKYYTETSSKKKIEASMAEDSMAEDSDPLESIKSNNKLFGEEDIDSE